MKSSCLVIVACLAALLPPTLAIKYRDCGSQSGKLQSVAISGCENQDRCPLKKGSNATATVVFSSSTTSSSLTSQVFGIVSFVNVSFPLPNPDGCKDSNITCPIEPNKTYYFSGAVYVDPSYPSVDVTVQWELFDQNNQRLFCFLVPCQVVSNSLSSRRHDKQLLEKLLHVQPVIA